MENYMKGETVEVEELSPFPDLHSSVITMRVNAGSKIRNIMGYAIKKMKDPEVKQITWNGTGNAINKTVTCAEIMKRKIKGLHQVTNIRFRRVEDYWEPQVEGLERLKVNRDIPAASILLSKDPLDTSQPGFVICNIQWPRLGVQLYSYQAPGSQGAWLDRPRDDQTKRGPKTGSSQQKKRRKVKKDKSESDTDNKTSSTSAR